MKKKFLLIVLVIALIIAMLINTAIASSFIATMTASKTAVAESTEFTVTVKVSNIDAGSNGINSVSGIFSYDNKIFESITTSSISGLNGWQASYYPETGKIVLFKPTYTKNDEDILQVTLKTKASTTGKSGVVSFKSVSASNSEADILASDISTTITVGNVSSDSEGSSSSGSNNSNNNNSNNNNNNNNNGNTSTPQTINTTTQPIGTTTNTSRNTTNNTTSNIVTPSTVNQSSNVSEVQSETNSDIPYTGASDNIMRAIFVVLVIAGISYFKYESIKEN